MAEKNNMEMISSLLGEQGQDALQMMQRLERLQRLMGTPKPKEPPVAEKTEPMDVFSRSKNEDMISAAIPFLDREYQKEIYVIVRLMEMRRVLQGGLLETREKQAEPPAVRRRKLLGAVQPFLQAEERTQLQNFIRLMDMKQIMGSEGLK